MPEGPHADSRTQRHAHARAQRHDARLGHAQADVHAPISHGHGHRRADARAGSDLHPHHPARDLPALADPYACRAGARHVHQHAPAACRRPVQGRGGPGGRVVVYTIGLGQSSGPNREINADLLRAAASAPSKYYEAPDASRLADIYGTLTRVIPCGGARYWPERR